MHECESNFRVIKSPQGNEYKLYWCKCRQTWVFFLIPQQPQQPSPYS